MSDPESFLSRWSRLKRESNTVAQPESGPAADAAPTDSVKPAESMMPAPDAVGPTAAADVTSPALPFDPGSLPPVTSITQASDIRQFLQAGVPAELVRAALRAAWVTDPTIRDFIGIADNQWDFNDPAAMPGFGPLEAADSARGFAQRSAAQVNEAAGAVARSSDLVTRQAIDAANLPREGQVDRVWLSAGMTGQGASRPTAASLVPEALEPMVALETSGPRASSPGPSELSPERRPRPRVHGTALPKARR